MGTITVINNKEYKKQPVPEVGKEYHIFDDGKIKPSRHYMTKIVELIPFEECTDEELIATWKDEVLQCYWLYNKTTDYFVKAEAKEYVDNEHIYFVRTTNGGWFSLDYPTWFSGARLDIDGSLYQKMQEWFQEAK